MRSASRGWGGRSQNGILPEDTTFRVAGLRNSSICRRPRTLTYTIAYPQSYPCGKHLASGAYFMQVFARENPSQVGGNRLRHKPPTKPLWDGGFLLALLGRSPPNGGFPPDSVVRLTLPWPSAGGGRGVSAAYARAGTEREDFCSLQGTFWPRPA
jgi:hypothetical protein